MNDKTKSISAIFLILGGLALAIGMFVIFLKQDRKIHSLNDQINEKNVEYANLLKECINDKNKLMEIDSAAAATELKKIRNGEFYLGVSSPSLKNAENLELITALKQEGYNIWYANENTGDLGNIYYYKEGAAMAADLQKLIYDMFPDRNRFKLKIQAGGSGEGIPSTIRDHAILIKL